MKSFRCRISSAQKLSRTQMKEPTFTDCVWYWVIHHAGCSAQIFSLRNAVLKRNWRTRSTNFFREIEDRRDQLSFDGKRGIAANGLTQRMLRGQRRKAFRCECG